MNMRRYVEAKVEKERTLEARQAGLEKMLWENNILAGHGKSEHVVEKKRMACEREEMMREQMMDQRYVQEEQDRVKRQQLTQMEEKIANELERRHALRIREEQDRKRICESSEELRSLKEKLHAAQVTKQRSMQIVEKQKRFVEERQRDELMAVAMEEDRLKQLEMQAIVEMEKEGQRTKARDIQHQQIRDKEALRIEALQEFEKERAMVEEVVQKIREEDDEQEAMRAERKAETRQHLQDFMVQQAEWRREQDRRAAEENEKIEDYARMKRAREAALEEEKQRLEEEKKRILNAMIGEQEAKSKQQEELDYLRNELYQEEYEAQIRQREKEAEMKRIADRAEMLRAYEHQMALKEEKMRIEREEEERIRQQLLAKFAEDDRIEQMNQQRRRMKVQDHKREVERLIDMRRAMYDEERSKEREIEEALSEGEKKRAVIIEEERQRLLKEYARELKDFLPKGTLETENDVGLVYT